MVVRRRALLGWLIKDDIEDANRLVDVLELVITAIFESEIESIANLITHRARNHDPAGLRNALQTRGHIHAAAVDVSVLDDDVAEVYAHAELQVTLPLAKAALHFRSARDRIHHARKLSQKSIAGQLHNPAAMLRDLSVDHLATKPL